jgi:hypothetical protein
MKAIKYIVQMTQKYKTNNYMVIRYIKNISYYHNGNFKNYKLTTELTEALITGKFEADHILRSIINDRAQRLLGKTMAIPKLIPVTVTINMKEDE